MGAGTDIAMQYFLNDGCINWTQVGQSALIGGAFGGAGSLIGSVLRPTATITAETVIGGAANRTAFEAYKDGLLAAMERPAVTDGRLSSLINKLYRPNAMVGNGSTAAAVRQELASGASVGGKLHSQKAADSIRALEKWLEQNPTARPGDRAAAENLIRDMRNALGGN